MPTQDKLQPKTTDQLYFRQGELLQDIKAVAEGMGQFDQKKLNKEEYEQIINEHMIFLSYLVTELIKIRDELKALNCRLNPLEDDLQKTAPASSAHQGDILNIDFDLNKLNSFYNITGCSTYIARSRLSNQTKELLRSIYVDDTYNPAFATWVKAEAKAMNDKKKDAGSELEQTGEALKQQILKMEKKLTVFIWLKNIIKNYLNIDCLGQQIDDLKHDINDVKNKLDQLQQPSTDTINMCKGYSQSILGPAVKKDDLPDRIQTKPPVISVKIR